MTKKEILEMTGLSEEEFYRQYPTEESWTESYKKGGWIQKATASIKRRGTEGVCTGSKFGGPTCRPGTKRYNLAKTFRKMAKSRKEEGGYVDMYEEGGKIPDNVLRSRLESHMSPAEAQDYIDSYGEGGYTVKRSSDRKGKTHVVIGPDGTKKYFGDPKLGERGKSKYGKEAFYARHAKNLKNNPYFRAYARATWEDGGMVNSYGDGGQLPVDLLEARMKASGASQNEINAYKAQHYGQGGMVDMYGGGGDTVTNPPVTNPLLNIPESQRFVTYPKGYLKTKYAPIPSKKEDTTSNDSVNYAKLAIDIGGMFFYPLSLVGSAIDLYQGDYTGAVAGLVPFGKGFKALKALKVASQGKAAAKLNRGVNNLLVAHGATQAMDTKSDIVDPILKKKEYGGLVDAYQLMGMPTPSMYAMGGDVMIEDYARGGMIKRKDGSYSRRGLWDNIRANRGSGKKPTKEMLKQERKIRAAEKKEYGGMVNMYGMGGTTNMSHVISAKNFPNMGYAMGGPVMYKKGAFVTGLKDYGLAIADNVTSIVNPDIIGSEAYSDTGFGKTMKGYSDVVGGLANAGAPIIAGAIGGPIASAAIGAAQNMSKQFVPQQQDTSTTRQIGNMFGSLAPLGGAIYAASAGSGAGSTTTGTPQAAMGGPINYPEGYQKNITFAMGGNVDMTTGELEHGENLNVHRNGRWKTVTKYESGGMGRHNADGTPKPAQEVGLPVGGSIASRLYQKEDDLAEATNDTLHKEALHGKIITAKSGGYVRDSYANGGPVNRELRFPGRIEWTKRKKEAKEEAMAMKKYGGAIKRMFAKGGMVPMYDGGSTVLNTSAPSNYWSWGNFQPVLPLDNPGVYASLPEFMGTSTVPGSSFGSTPTNPFDISLPLQPMQPRPIDPSSVKPAIPPASPQGVYIGPGSRYYTGMPTQTFDVFDITGFDSGQYPNKVPYRIEAGESWPGTAASKTAGSPGAGGDMSNFGKYAETAAMLGPGLYNLGMGLFSKPEKFNKLKLSGQLKSYETPYETDYAPYYATKYALRQAGQSSPAALSQLFATFSKQEAANRLANREQNLRRQMAADQFNLSRADQVAQANLAIDQLNAQQRAARRSMIGEGISNIGEVAAYNKGLRQDKNVLGDLYKNLELKDGKWVYKGQ